MNPGLAPAPSVPKKFHGDLSDDRKTLSLAHFRQIKSDHLQWHVALDHDEAVELLELLQHFVPKMAR